MSYLLVLIHLGRLGRLSFRVTRRGRKWGASPGGATAPWFKIVLLLGVPVFDFLPLTFRMDTLGYLVSDVLASCCNLRGKRDGKGKAGFLGLLLPCDVLTWDASGEVTTAPSRSLLGLFLTLCFPVGVAVFFAEQLRQGLEAPAIRESLQVDAATALRPVLIVPRAFRAADALPTAFITRKSDLTNACVSAGRAAQLVAANGAPVLQPNGTFALPLCPLGLVRAWQPNPDNPSSLQAGLPFPAEASAGLGLFAHLTSLACPLPQSPQALASDFDHISNGTAVPLLDVVYGGATWTLDSSMLGSFGCPKFGDSYGDVDTSLTWVVQLTLAVEDTVLQSGEKRQAITVLESSSSGLNLVNIAPLPPDFLPADTGCDRGQVFQCECNATTGEPVALPFQRPDFLEKCSRACGRCLARGYKPLPDPRNATPFTLVGNSACPLSLDLVRSGGLNYLSGGSDRRRIQLPEPGSSAFTGMAPKVFSPGTCNIPNVSTQVIGDSASWAYFDLELGLSNASANARDPARLPICAFECGWLEDVGLTSSQEGSEGSSYPISLSKLFPNNTAFFDCYRGRARGPSQLTFPDGTLHPPFDPTGRCFRVAATVLDAVGTAVNSLGDALAQPLFSADYLPGFDLASPPALDVPFDYIYSPPSLPPLDPSGMPGRTAVYARSTFTGLTQGHKLMPFRSPWQRSSSSSADQFPDFAGASPSIIVLLRAGPTHTLTTFTPSRLEILSYVGTAAGFSSLLFAVLLLSKRLLAQVGKRLFPGGSPGDGALHKGVELSTKQLQIQQNPLTK